MTEEELKQFLQWLDSDQGKAGLKYEQLRQRLILYFVRRQCPPAEDLTDVVLDAAALHYFKQNSLLLTKPLPYIFGIARNVCRRYFDRQNLIDGEADWGRLLPTDYNEEHWYKERRSRCLRICLQNMKEQDRQLLLRYYLKQTKTLDEYRLGLAKKFGLTINGLRLKMMRLRDRLRDCIRSCEQNAQA